MHTVNAAIVVHTPAGPVWLTAGSVVPEELVGLIREDLLDHSPEPASTPEPEEAEGEGAPADETSTDGEAVKVEPEDAGTPEPGEAEGGNAEIPYASYPAEKWAEYAQSLDLDATGMKKVQIINLIAGHFNISTEGQKPADTVDAIREAAN